MKILDCTLRDGGYCNQWEFGIDNIKKIIEGLCMSGIDIIECGFLTEKVRHKKDITQFNTLDEIKDVLPERSYPSQTVCMINYGEYALSSLPVNDGGSIDGIRLAFHKKDRDAALKESEIIKEKGYKLFLQPMVSLNYSDDEFLDMIRKSNELKPYAFYIVDSFGVMKQRDLIRLFYLVEHNLDDDIMIGFHSHNNMQLAYSNAQALVDIRSRHKMVIDCSVYGMGRGAGNLNTELFVEYLNDNMGTNYMLKPLLNIIDEILDDFHQRWYWGYSLPNYLSASHNTHPNYAGYLNDKHTLTVKEMDDIFELMDDEKRVYYDKNYIENLYLRYLSTGESQEKHETELETIIQGKTILLIAPGRSSTIEREHIKEFAKREDVISVSINYDYPYCDTNYIFLSNMRRFKELAKDKRGKCIVTSNIPADGIYYQTDYHTLLNSHEMVQDNAGMMAIKFFANNGAKEIWLAGLDGYSHDTMSNYGDDRMAYVTRNAVLDAMNNGICKVLRELARYISINFLTKPQYVSLGNE